MSAHPAYIPGCRHDVFVSYAWVDNQPPDGELTTDGGLTPGWVHALVDNLKSQLSVHLGRKDWGDIWIDRRIDATASITPEVEDAVRGSALMLVILSEGYLASPWCEHERELFERELRFDGGTEGRFFVVHKMDIEQHRRPQSIRNLNGFSFFHRAHPDAPARTLGFPLPIPKNPDDRPYYARVDDLSHAMSERLRELRERARTPAARPERPEGLVELAESGRKTPKKITAPPGGEIATREHIDEQAEGAPEEGKPIFIAEATTDLRDRRDQLIRQLRQSGLPILPASYYDRAPDAFRREMEHDLARSLLFVQLLGPYCTPKTADLPERYEGLQLALAKSAEIPILRWHDPDLDVARVDAPELIAGAEVIVSGFEDFKRTVESEARRLMLPPVPQPPAGETLILIRAAESDEDTACRIGDKLYDDHRVGYEVVADRDTPMADLVVDAPYQGLMVIYDTADRDWARAQVRDCRAIALDRKERAPVCAVYDEPRPHKRPLGIRFPRFHFLQALAGPEFTGFLQALGAAVGGAGA